MYYDILIVDDESAAREGLKMMVSTLEQWVWAGEASNGVTAMEQIKLYKPDLILLDIRMPEMDGITLLENIRELGLDSLVVLLTGYTDFEYTQKAIRYGAFDYLLKPTRVPDIVEVMKKAQLHIDQQRIVKREHDISLRMAEDYELGLFERNMREIIYGGNFEEISDFHFFSFSACDRLKVISLVLNSPNPSDREYCDHVLRSGLHTKFHSPYLVLKDGTSDWVIILGKIGDEDFSMELNQFTAILESEFQSVGISNWRMGVGRTSEFKQVNHSYEQSKFAAYFTSKDKQVVYYEKILESNASLFQLPIELEYMMLQHVRKGETEGALRVFSELEIHYRNMTVRELDKRAALLLIQLHHGQSQPEVECLTANGAAQDASGDHQAILKRLKLGVEYCAERARSYLSIQMNHVIQRVIEMIHEQYAENIKLGDIAWKLGVNPSYLSTLFKQEMGVSFSDYLSHYRIEKSLTLLKESTLKIYEVAQKVGYTDGRHFSQLFRKSKGMTPFEFRNRNGILIEHKEKINM
ncbi:MULTISPECIES: response regulator [Paenibacillus]|uniref:DNA-binding response regulator n=1 Tax=Paenibacillus lautus TaxID=1401 RepID=A0A1R1ANB6_PAELA|nr:response regulator [Paenibacillus lautus]OME87061.1 hypothetical protein BK123_31900 [Paenibacillus lautus]